MKALNLLNKDINFRHAVKEDCESLLSLMKELAKFEGYLHDFAISLEDLIQHGFSETKTFTAIVAELDEKLLGYLVYYVIPFTYDLKPTLFIKELYVDQVARSKGVGKGLMSLAIKDAKNKHCGRLKWDVLSDNINAQKFYQSFGAAYDNKWQGYLLKLS